LPETSRKRLRLSGSFQYSPKDEAEPQYTVSDEIRCTRACRESRIGRSVVLQDPLPGSALAPFHDQIVLADSYRLHGLFLFRLLLYVNFLLQHQSHFGDGHILEDGDDQGVALLARTELGIDLAVDRHTPHDGLLAAQRHRDVYVLLALHSSHPQRACL